MPEVFYSLEGYVGQDINPTNQIVGAVVNYSALDSDGNVYASGSTTTGVLGTFVFPPALRANAGGTINIDVESEGYQDYSATFLFAVTNDDVFRDVLMTHI